MTVTFDAPPSRADEIRGEIAAALFERPEVVTVRVERSSSESVCRIDVREPTRRRAAAAATQLVEGIFGPLVTSCRVIEALAVTEAERTEASPG